MQFLIWQQLQMLLGLIEYEREENQAKEVENSSFQTRLRQRTNNIPLLAIIVVQSDK